MNTEIGKLMDQLCDQSTPHNPSCDLSSSSVQQVEAPIATDMYNDLQTLATIYNKDANCIGGELLTIALREAFSCLSKEQLDQLQDVRQQNERQNADKHMEEQRFDAGCT